MSKVYMIEDVNGRLYFGTLAAAREFNRRSPEPERIKAVDAAAWCESLENLADAWEREALSLRSRLRDVVDMVDREFFATPGGARVLAAVRGFDPEFVASCGFLRRIDV